MGYPGIPPWRRWGRRHTRRPPESMYLPRTTVTPMQHPMWLRRGPLLHGFPAQKKNDQEVCADLRGHSGQPGLTDGLHSMPGPFSLGCQISHEPRDAILMAVVCKHERSICMTHDTTLYRQPQANSHGVNITFVLSRCQVAIYNRISCLLTIAATLNCDCCLTTPTQLLKA